MTYHDAEREDVRRLVKLAFELFFRTAPIIRDLFCVSPTTTHYRIVTRAEFLNHEDGPHRKLAI